MEIQIDSEGRLVLSPELLEELGWAPGTTVQLERDLEGLRVRAGRASSASAASSAAATATPAGGSGATPASSPYGSATPAGVDLAALKEEARQLADAMRNVGGTGGNQHGDTEARRGTPSDSVGDEASAPDDQPSTPTTDYRLPTTDYRLPATGVLAPHHGRVPQVPASCYVAPGAFLAGEVALGEECSVWPGASLRGDVNRIEIGARTNVQDGAVIHGNYDGPPTTIGAGVTIGHQATVHGCSVEDEVLIGIHAVVLDGARLGKGCMIGAGAVVPPGIEIPPGKLVLGVPGKVTRDLTPAELEANRANAAEYVRLRGEYLAGQVLGVEVLGVGPSFPTPQRPNTSTPQHLNTPVYRCRRIQTPVAIDGALDEAAWSAAEPASPFQLSDGSSPPRFPTEARLCWDETHLYVAFSCQDSDVWGTYTRRDDPLFEEEVVEIFLCPTGNPQHYFELEVSPRGTIFDATVFNPELDRRTMLVDREWDSAGLQAAVRVAGTLGQRDDHDLGWIVELAIPFADLGLSGPPHPNEQWRMNLYRIERGEVEEFSAWSPTLKSPPDFHVPSRFGTLVFVES